MAYGYTGGTITLANGVSAVTGVATAWGGGAILPGRVAALREFRAVVSVGTLSDRYGRHRSRRSRSVVSPQRCMATSRAAAVRSRSRLASSIRDRL